MNSVNEIIVSVISWNYLNRELFEPYGFAPDDQRPKVIGYETQGNLNELDDRHCGQVDLLYLHERAGINGTESPVLARIFAEAEKVFLLIHEPILKTWEGMSGLNQIIEGKLSCPPIPTHSTHGPFIDLMYKMGESFQRKNKADYDSNLKNLRILAGSHPSRNRLQAHYNAACEIMNRTLHSSGPGRVLWMAENYEDLFVRELVQKPGVKEVLEAMDRQYELEASVGSLRRELHRLLFAVDD